MVLHATNALHARHIVTGGSFRDVEHACFVCLRLHRTVVADDLDCHVINALPRGVLHTASHTETCRLGGGGDVVSMYQIIINIYTLIYFNNVLWCIVS